ncbi:hypothetical protein ANN_09157 [Periplaneta americana]|uniref:Uncharacterized protein n=1 Tax=Periplaneta americana TaxID=6978 RepID=A0ABQ8TM13_PERAM|nr:hypothetical protein ANN_09157 [Periplaneta americana]
MNLEKNGTCEVDRQNKLGRVGEERMMLKLIRKRKRNRLRHWWKEGVNFFQKNTISNVQYILSSARERVCDEAIVAILVTVTVFRFRNLCSKSTHLGGAYDKRMGGAYQCGSVLRAASAHGSYENKGWTVEEEIYCLAENGSTRRVDILAYNADTKQGIIVDPTIRFEVECHQSAEVHLEKKSIYEPTINYFKLKYALIYVEVFGLLIGARGTIPAFFEEFRRQFALPTSLRDDIVIIVLKKSCEILINHMVPH